jgi:dephospho-CoA kinase
VSAGPGGGSRRTVRIGLTGPIGCGKSTVAAWLEELGAVAIDADGVAREVTEPGTSGLAAVANEFGPGILREDGSLDRPALGRRVFSDPEALGRLEAIVHPAVRPVILERMEAASEAGAPAVVVEAIKLVEGGLAALCDEVWLVTCEADQQLARLLGRGADRADAEARIAAQSGFVERLMPSATRVIDTNGAIEDARLRVKAAFRAALGHEAP